MSRTDEGASSRLPIVISQGEPSGIGPEIAVKAWAALAGRIAEKSPLAVAACLGSVTRGINVSIDEGLAIEANYFARMVGTRDIEEGISAWLEKRAPRFTGR